MDRLLQPPSSSTVTHFRSQSKASPFLNFQLIHRDECDGGASDEGGTVLKGHEGAVFAARFNGDGIYALTCGKFRTIRLWNPHRGILIKTYKSHGREVHDTSDNAKFCSCGGDRQVYYWDVSTGRVICKFHGHNGEVNALKFNESSSVVVSAGFDRS